MAFKNVRLAGKLSVGFGTVLAVIALSSAFTLTEVRHVAEIERVNATSDAAVDEIDQAWGSVARAQAAVRKYVLTGAAVDKNAVGVAITEVHRHLGEARKVLVADGPEFVADLDAYGTKVDAYLNEALLVETQLASDPATRPKAVEMVSSNATGPLSDAASAALKTLESKVEPWADSFTQAGNAAMDRISWVVMGAGAASMLLGALMAWLITRAVGRPLAAMTGTMRRLAGGDNDVAVPALGQRDEVGEMAAAVQVFKDAAVAQRRLEAEAAETRRLADDLRAKSEAAAAEVARKQAEVVEAVSSGLEHLAEGDLAFRLERPLAPDYEKLRADFNDAMDQLQERCVWWRPTPPRSGRGRPRSPRPRTTCRAAPNSRPRASRRPPPPSTRSPPR